MDKLWKICKKLPTDFKPWGKRDRDPPGQSVKDCSCGCKFFARLAWRGTAPDSGWPCGGRGGGRSRWETYPDLYWGVCTNPKSPRAGLLTHEAQGCKFFKLDPSLD